MKLYKETIRKFAELTSRIKTNPIMPTLGYIMYQSKNNIQTLTKTNLSSYCRYIVGREEMDDCKALLEERIVIALASNENPNSLTKGIIEFHQEGSIVKMTDGKFDQSFEPSSADDYPSFPLNEDEVTKLPISNAMLASIAIAANYTNEKSKTNFSFVHVNGDVFASDNFNMYHKAFPGENITAILNKEAAQIIGSMTDCVFYGNETIDFVESGDITYGFVRSEITNKPPYMSVVSKFNKTNIMTLVKEDLERFCEMTRTIHDSSDDPVSTLENSGMFLTLNYKHDGLNKSNRVDIAAEGMYEFEPLRFNPRGILPALQALPFKTIGLSITGAYCVLTAAEDPNYSGLITGVSKTQNK